MPDDEMSEAELRALLKPQTRPPQPVVKGRQWVVTDRDIAAFMKLLRETFPTIIFLVFRKTGKGGSKASLLPPPTGYRVGVRDDIRAVLPRDGWDAEEFCAQPSHLRDRLPDTTFWFCVSGGPYVTTLESGRIVENIHASTLCANHMRSDRETARFLDRVWRLSTKITANKANMVDRETGGTYYRNIPADERLGFDALGWCQQRLNRTLDGCYRPADDWSMPDSPYYVRRRRVVRHDYAAYWAEIEKLRDRIPLFSYPIGYRRSDGALVTANDIDLDPEQLVPVDELDRDRLVNLIRKRWEAGEWDEYFNAREWVTLEKAVAALESDEYPNDFPLGKSKLKSSVFMLEKVPEFRRYLSTTIK